MRVFACYVVSKLQRHRCPTFGSLRYYTDRASAACRRSECQLLLIEGCNVVSVTDPYGRILRFLDRTCCVNPIDNTHYAPIQVSSKFASLFFYKTFFKK
jgi:hypothetical protein